MQEANLLIHNTMTTKQLILPIVALLYLAGVFDLSQRQGLASMDSIYEYTPENYSYGYAIITF